MSRKKESVGVERGKSARANPKVCTGVIDQGKGGPIFPSTEAEASYWDLRITNKMHLEEGGGGGGGGKECKSF